MVHFVAIKTHYDHRRNLPHHFKYSRLVSRPEHDEYMALAASENTGKGFHECLNFAIPESGGRVGIYLPPTCIPGTQRHDDEFVFFSFTYKRDPVLASHIVGIHGGAWMLEETGIRKESIEGVEPLIFSAEADPDLVTVLTPPLAYDETQGVYTPKFSLWGFGLRNLEPKYASRIVDDALLGAQRQRRKERDREALLALDRQLEVLRSVQDRYFKERNGDVEKPRDPLVIVPPDKEIGYRGEQHVFEREQAYARKHGIPLDRVQWVSQAVPTAPYDIKTVRLTPVGLRDHYLEVKSSRAEQDSNVYVSSGQLEFFRQTGGAGDLVLVQFSRKGEWRGTRDVRFDEVEQLYDFVPIKFKLCASGLGAGRPASDPQFVTGLPTNT